MKKFLKIAGIVILAFLDLWIMMALNVSAFQAIIYNNTHPIVFISLAALNVTVIYAVIQFIRNARLHKAERISKATEPMNNEINFVPEEA